MHPPHETKKPELWTILLVEDNADHAELVVRAIEDRAPGVRVRRVNDGAQALDYLKRKNGFADVDKAPRPDLVLLDLRLPKVDGLDVLRYIKQRKELYRIPVVVLTTSTNESDLKRAYDSHVNSYLQKPFDFQALNRMIADMIRYWLSWNCHPRQETALPKIP